MKRGKSFKGIWIPRSILELPDLNLRQVVILSDIASLNNGKKQFFKSNETIAKECRTSPATVKRDLNRLEDLGLIARAHHEGVRFISVTARVKQISNQAQGVYSEGHFDTSGGSLRPTSNTVTNAVISTLQEKQIDGERFNEFESNVEVRKAMDAWFDHLANLTRREVTENSKKQTWLTLFEESGGKTSQAIKTIQHSITSNWKSLHSPPEKKLFSGQRSQLNVEQALEWASNPSRRRF